MYHDLKTLSKLVFELHSNDLSLIDAFQYQCKRLNVKSEIVKTINTSKVVVLPVESVISKDETAEALLYNALYQPRALDEKLQAELGLSRQIFTKAINSLSSSNKIVRTLETKKKWIQR